MVLDALAAAQALRHEREALVPRAHARTTKSLPAPCRGRRWRGEAHPTSAINDNMRAEDTVAKP